MTLEPGICGLGSLRLMLLDRDKELGLLSGLLAGVGSSGGKVGLVRGEAGIGKSLLVRECFRGRDDEAHVYFGFCDDLLTAQPLGPFWDVAREESSLGEVLEKGDRRGPRAPPLTPVETPTASNCWKRPGGGLNTAATGSRKPGRLTIWRRRPLIFASWS